MISRNGIVLFLAALVFYCQPLWAQNHGSLEVKGLPSDGATHIFIDGAEMLSAPPWPFEVGAHSYKISRPGYLPLSGTVVVKADKSTVVNYTLASHYAGAAHYFARLPLALQQRGRWISLAPAGLGFEYRPGDVESAAGSMTTGGLTLSLAQLTLYSPKPYIPLLLGLLPVQLSFRGFTGSTVDSCSFDLAAVRSRLFIGAYWSGYRLLVAAGLQGWIGGQIMPEFAILGGGGWFAHVGFFLGNYFLLDIRYDMDIQKNPGHTILLEWQINIFGRQRR